MEHNPTKIPSPLLSLVPILVLVTLLFVTIRIFGSDALSGGSQIVLLTATAICCLIAMTYSKVRWKVLELAMINNITGVATALIILLIIGALSGSWMISGVVPTLIYYGMQIIHPSFFLASTCIICAVVSVMTGSSWTTIATIGIALLGIGQAQGFSDGWIAGAIISGAYFGDKISPATATDQIEQYSIALNNTFHITPWLLIVPVVTGILIAKRVPSIITLFISAALAGMFALIFQPHLLLEISGLPVGNIQSNFKGLLMTFYGSTSIKTGNPELNSLVATRGMSGMMNTIWLILCAMCFGGAMAASGMLGSITSVFLRFMKRTVGLVTSTIASGLFLNICTADQYISIILTGNMFKDIYEKKGYESRLLSRTVEDSVTVTSVLIPWNTCGMTQATILGVATFIYLPYCFFNLISPLMSITIAAIGFKIKRKNEKAKSVVAG